MKHLIYVLTLLAALSTVIQPMRGDGFAQIRQLGRGVNIIGYDMPGEATKGEVWH